MMKIVQHSMAFFSTVAVTYQYQNKNWVRVGHSKYKPYDLLQQSEHDETWLSR